MTAGELAQPPLMYRRRPDRPADPADELRELCARQPIPRVPLTSGTMVWLVTRYADAKQVLADPRFSSNLTTPGTALPQPGERTLAEELQDRQPGTFLEYDPPDHTRLRALIAGEFTAGAMRALRPRVEAIVERCLDETEYAGLRAGEAQRSLRSSGPAATGSAGLRAGEAQRSRRSDGPAATGPAGPVDLVETFALPMPSRVICEMLGVPPDDGFDFAGHTLVMTDLMATAEQSLAARDAMRGYMRELVARHRKDPGDNILGRLVRDHGDEVSDEELVGIGNLLLIAGHETTAMMLGIGTLVLLQHPDQLALMRDEPSVVPAAVEELLRYTSIANHGAIRTAIEDIEVGGQLIRKGDAVAVSIPMVNRDETRYADPDRFDITREAKRSQLAFGHGIHHCVAAPMARLELQIAYPALLRRFPTLRLAVPVEEVPVRTSNATHGVFALPVTW